MKKKFLAIALSTAMVLGLVGCAGGDTKSTGNTSDAGSTAEASADSTDQLEATEITVFAAKSLNTVLDELIAKYNETQPNVTVTASYDSSGTLMTQIQEGAACDVFFSAAQKQMDTLQDAALVTEGTRHNVVNNQVCVVTQTDSATKVTGLDNLGDAASLAIADGSVPVGNYTRKALIASGILPETEDSSTITTQQIADALGGVEINECANVGAVTAAISEGANEVGTVYKSDTYGFEDKIKILQEVSYDLTGDVIYPIAQIENPEADELAKTAAEDFINFIISEDAKTVFDSYYFDTNVTD